MPEVSQYEMTLYATIGRMVKIATNPNAAPATVQWAEERGARALKEVTILYGVNK